MATDNHNAVYRNDDGKKVSRVTTVLNNIGWAARGILYWNRECWLNGLDPEVELKRAADAGTLAHDMAEHHVNLAIGTESEPPDLFEYDFEIVEMAENAFEQFLLWEAEAQPEWILAEEKLVSEHFQVGGRLDLLANINGLLTIVDIKTSKGLYGNHVLQVVGAYRQFYEEINVDQKIEQCIILRLDRMKPVYREYVIPEEDWILAEEGWAAAVTLHRVASGLNKMMRKFDKEDKVNE